VTIHHLTYTMFETSEVLGEHI